MSTDTKYCYECGSEVTSQDRFCADCGADLQKIVIPNQTGQTRRITTKLWAPNSNNPQAEPQRRRVSFRHSNPLHRKQLLPASYSVSSSDFCSHGVYQKPAAREQVSLSVSSSGQCISGIDHQQITVSPRASIQVPQFSCSFRSCSIRQ